MLSIAKHLASERETGTAIRSVFHSDSQILRFAQDDKHTSEGVKFVLPEVAEPCINAVSSHAWVCVKTGRTGSYAGPSARRIVEAICEGIF
jgi:hypothetical protein